MNEAESRLPSLERLMAGARRRPETGPFEK
jgi:hypothetical protein